MKPDIASSGSASDPRELLVAAAKVNDTEGVRSLLERHPELKARLNDPMPELPFGSLLLGPAVRRQNREMINLFLSAGADINARSDWWAGGFGILDSCDPGFAPFLIERGAFVDAHAAARLGLLDRLKQLISANPGLVNARGGDGQTPLHFAANVPIAQYLLDRGAGINARDIDHESTPAQYMVRDRQDVARFLVSRGCETDLLMAAALGDLKLVRKHLEANPACIRMSISEEYFPKRDSRAGGTIYIWTLGQHKTAHQIAHEFGHDEVFRLLTERSPDELKLTQACELEQEDIVRQLLSRLRDLARTLSHEDRRRLAYAAQNNNTEAVRLMLESGWPVDVRGQHGGTPLHWAAFHGNDAMTEIILRFNPPLEVLDADYHATPLGWAIHGSQHGWYRDTGNYAATVELLLKAGAPVPEKIEGTDAVKNVLRRYSNRR
jgi:ankyrin repeat protein